MTSSPVIVSDERPLPCPFCGCADIIASNVGEDEDNWFVGCMEAECGVNPGVFCPDSEAEAASMWNRRALAISVEERIAELEKAEARWRDNLQNSWAALRMIREAVEEFGPIADLEGEDAVLLRGPEPVHAAEAIAEALGRIRATLTEGAKP